MRPKAQPHPVGAGQDRRLATLAHRQHGIVSIEQLLDLGYSRGQIKRATSLKRLHRIDRSVYAVGHTRLSLEGQCFAAVFACGPGALLSHHSAAWAHGLARWKP